jgi:hypothetical protein
VSETCSAWANCHAKVDDAPMCNALPARTTSFSASSVSSIGTSGSQRWIWYRSTKSVPRRFRLASISAKIALRDRPMPLGPLRMRWLTLVAITTSSRRA